MAKGTHLCFDVLKKLAEESTCSDPELLELKNYFSQQIGSRRKFDAIHSLQDLIDCLERAGQINDEEVVPFKKIGEQLSNKELEEGAAAYQPIKRESPSTNQYQQLRIAEEFEQQLRISPSTNSAIQAPVPDRQTISINPIASYDTNRASIFNKLAQELGRSWRDLGRSLGIAEGSMDDIEVRFPRDLKSCILNVLKLFEEDAVNDPRQHVFLLCNALSECGRKDLRRKVEQILSY